MISEIQMQRLKYIHSLAAFALGLLMAGMALPALALDGIGATFKGNLINAPCTLRPADEDLKVDLGQIFQNDFYQTGRSDSKPFTIHLDDCDAGLASSVKVKFSGSENTSLPGLLALDTGGGTRGVAIAIENAAGVLPINTQTSALPLNAGSNDLHFTAYVQGESLAVLNKTIVPGPFVATATFTFQYP
ncbi:Fimbrial protein [Comamonas testosteroni KF-1]|uniref:Fimbrial protein n=2 Tax=Comamonas testosteroni TaxID=285 RepID=B7X0D3_COMTK|nr:Fimbrial protein [Comamonas testosteroni KF-1]